MYEEILDFKLTEDSIGAARFLLVPNELIPEYAQLKVCVKEEKMSTMFRTGLSNIFAFSTFNFWVFFVILKPYQVFL